MKKIPITVLTGFLGSGKTTLINKILAQAQGQGLKIAIIENELGTIGIDKKLITAGAPLGSIQGENIIQVAQGCICCTVRGDLAPALRELMQSGIEIDHIILETTGIADPLPIMQTIVADPYVSFQFELHNVVTVVDAVNYAANLEISTTSARQIALADIVYVSKLDTKSELKEKVSQHIAQKNPFAQVMYSDTHLVLNDLLAHSAHAHLRVDTANKLGSAGLMRSHDSDIAAYALTSLSLLRGARAQAWLNSISHALEQHILRIKGHICTQEGVYKVNCVRDSVVCELLTEQVSGEHTQTELVVIGHRLDAEMLAIIERGFRDLEEK